MPCQGASASPAPQGRRTAIDVFFRSLAERHGDGFAIVLSGGGSDGAVGTKAVKEAGGLVLVQDPRLSRALRGDAMELKDIVRYVARLSAHE